MGDWGQGPQIGGKGAYRSWPCLGLSRPPRSGKWLPKRHILALIGLDREISNDNIVQRLTTPLFWGKIGKNLLIM